MSKKQIKSFFDIVDIILKKHDYPDEEDINKFCSIWMCNNMFSCYETFTQMAHELSKIKMSNKEYFDFCYYGIPKNNVFIRYNAKKAKLDEELKMISEYFECNLEIAKQYNQLLSDEEKDNIYNYFDKGGFSHVKNI